MLVLSVFCLPSSILHVYLFLYPTVVQQLSMFIFVSVVMVDCDKEQENCLNNCLPSEVFTQWIFPNLHPVDICRCRCVCKTWLTWTVTYFRLVKSLDFCDGFSEYYISEDGLLSIIRVLVNLRYIRLDGLWRSATELNLVKLTRRCRRLEVLSIASCRGVTDEVLKAAALNCANLKVLDVSHCQQVDFVGVVVSV